MRRIFFKIIIIFLASFFAFSAFADLNSSINDIISNYADPNEKIGVYIENLQTNDVLFDYHSDEPFTPASTTKVFTAASAFLSLGPDYRYVTKISTNAPVLARTLNGNIYVQFSGDPTLTSYDVDLLVHQMRLRGIRRIDGNVVIDQSVFSGSYYGVGWTPSDVANWYGAPIAGAIINRNFNGRVIRSPNLFAQAIVARALRLAGIYYTGKIIEGDTPQNTTTIAIHDSASLQYIMGYMLKYSNDVYANAIFKTIGKVYANNGSYAGGAAAVNSILTSHLGSSFNPPKLEDGSGLSTLNEISPQQLVALYDYMYHDQDLYERFKYSLAISGQDGTLIDRLNDRLLAGNVYAKTGTFHHDNGGVSSLAGYLILPGKQYPVIAFAIMMNNISGDTGRAEYLQDEIVRAIARDELSQ